MVLRPVLRRAGGPGAKGSLTPEHGEGVSGNLSKKGNTTSSLYSSTAVLCIYLYYMCCLEYISLSPFCCHMKPERKKKRPVAQKSEVLAVIEALLIYVSLQNRGGGGQQANVVVTLKSAAATRWIRMVGGGRKKYKFEGRASIVSLARVT